MNISVYLADQNPHRDRSLGITNMTAVLLRHMLEYDNLRLEAISSRSSYSLDDDRIRQTQLPWRSDRMIGRLLADNLHPLFKQTKPNLWLYPKGFLPFLRRPAQPCVGFIHDTILLWSLDRYPEARSMINYGYWVKNLRRSVARFDLILTVSESAKSQILAFCERFNVKCPPLEVVYESPGEVNIPSNIEQSDCVVHLASRAPHKRTAWLVDEWRAALKRGKDLPRLLLIGSLPQGYEKLIESVNGIEKSHYLRDDDYRRTIASARALILPSEIEGFGLPALEAYMLGTPVCYVEGTAVDEILAMPGNTGCFSLSSSESLFAALDAVLSLETAEIHETGARLKKEYAANRFAKRVVKVICDFV